MRVLASFARLRDAGKIRFWGINGLGDVAAVHACLQGEIHSLQVCHSLLNPTAGLVPVAGFPFVDQRGLIGECAARGIGVLAFRVLAGGALSGSDHRHANATTMVETIFSSGSYEVDVRLARRLLPMVEAGHATDLVAAAIRFAVGTPGVTSAVLGMSTIRQLEDAASAALSGPLPAAATAFLATQWARFGTG
jgi:aryl-alcohol dehydrogenase-like predicted oxidoreductase